MILARSLVFWTTEVCALEGFAYAVVMVGLDSEFEANSEFIDIWDSPRLLVSGCSNAEVEEDAINSGLQDKVVDVEDLCMGATLTIG